MNSVEAVRGVHPEEHRARLQALRGIGLLEFLKGVLVLGAVAALHWIDPSDVADNFVNFLHLSPDHHLAHLMLKLADNLSNIKFWHLAVGACCYSGLRFAEAVGLWNARPWAEWIALVSGALYLPIEARVIVRHPTLFHAAILTINLAVVGFMFYLRIYVPRQEKKVHIR